MCRSMKKIQNTETKLRVPGRGAKHTQWARKMKSLKSQYWWENGILVKRIKLDQCLIPINISSGGGRVKQRPDIKKS